MIVQKEGKVPTNVYELNIESLTPYYCHVVQSEEFYETERIPLPVAIAKGIKEALEFRDYFLMNATSASIMYAGYDYKKRNFIGGIDQLKAFDA